jgi:hypothetical protein
MFHSRREPDQRQLRGLACGEHRGDHAGATRLTSKPPILLNV